MAVATRQDYDLATASPLLAPAPVLPAAQLGDLRRYTSGELYAGWYLADPQQRSVFLLIHLGPGYSLADLVYPTRLSDPAKSAYENALEILKKTLTADEYSTPWLQRQSSMRDVRDAVVQAMEEYKTKSKGNKVQEWLSSCSGKVMYYGGGRISRPCSREPFWLI